MANKVRNEDVKAFLAIALITMVGGTLLGLFFAEIPPVNIQAMNILLGALLTQLANMYVFYFPSNVESEKKNATIGVLADAVGPFPKKTTTTEIVEEVDTDIATEAFREPR